MDHPNMYIMPIDLMVTSSEFTEALIVESILNAIVKGGITDRFPKHVAQILRITSADLQTCLKAELNIWPFQNITRLANNKLHFRIPAAFDKIIRDRYGLDIHHRCMTFLNLRKQYEEAGRDPSARNLVAQNIAEELVELLLMFQLHLTLPDITDHIDIRMVFHEKPVPNASLMYMSPKKFVARMTNQRDRGCFPSHKQLMDIFTFCIQNVTARGEFDFTDMIINAITAQIQLFKKPLRFSYGPHSEYLVIFDERYRPSPDARQVLLQAITFSNQGRRSLSVLSIPQMMQKYIAWVSQPGNSVRTVQVATAFQHLIDTGFIPLTFKFPDTLRQILVDGRTGTN